MSAAETHSTQSTPRPSAWQVAGASFAGTTVEYYDFFIYGTAAALVFPQVFFPQASDFIGTLSAFVAFGAGYLARPLGGIIIGHFGDRIGRKSMLVLTLLIMGLGTIAIGLLPGYASVGSTAPALLLLLRLVQGFAFGGEWGGAVLMAFEFAPPHRRNLYASVPQAGPAAGVLLGNLAFLPVASLPEEQLLSWGWRVPFLLSGVLVIIGLIIRLKITESPDFQRVKEAQAEVRIPLFDALRSYPKQVLLVLGSFIGFGVFSIVVVAYILNYATSTVGVPNSTVLTAVIITTALQIVVVPTAGALADRYGRMPLFLTGCIGCMGAIFLLFALVNTGNFYFILLGYVIAFSLFYCIAYGAQPALFAAAFGTKVRYSGMSLGYQLANAGGSAVGPALATTLFYTTGTTLTISGYVAGMMLISLVCLMLLVRLVAKQPAEVGTRQQAT